MNDRTASGQFAEPAFGRAAEERDAGFTPMADPRKKEEAGDELTVREAAQQRAAETPEPIKRQYVDEHGEPVDSKETLTLERAAHDMAEMRRSEAAETAKEADAAMLEKLGVDVDKDEKSHPEPAKARMKSEESDGSEIDTLERALEQHPHVREALAAQIAENETARQNYRNSIDAAAKIAQFAFVSQFPEFANSTPEQHPQIAAAIAQQNPGRWAAIQAAVSNTAGLFEAQRVESRLAAEREAESFNGYATEQDAAFDKAMKGVPVEDQQLALGEIFAGLKAEGIEPAEFLRLLNSDRTLRHAAFQRILFEAGMYRAELKARDRVRSQVLRREVPPVQRPGSAQPHASSAQRALQGISARFDSEPSIKNAAALRAAQRRASR